MINSNKSPYHGVPLSVILMIIPSPILTLVLYAVLRAFQTQFTNQLNLAAAVALGFGVGAVYNLGCVILGALEEHWLVVKRRAKEFFADLEVSFSLAARWWWNDIKTNGVAFWIELSALVVNAAVFTNALVTFIKMWAA